jgi:2'-5' RNA ligase
LFLAINPPVAVRHAARDATAPLRDAMPHASWVDESRLHLTLKFFGEQPASLVQPLGDALREVGARHAAFELTLAGAGAFPNLRRPRVIWIGTLPQPALHALHEDVEQACGALGLAREPKPFRGHITIGRLREGGKDAGIEGPARRVNYQQTFFVDSMDLVLSDLTSAGAHYTVLTTAALGAN